MKTAWTATRDGSAEEMHLDEGEVSFGTARDGTAVSHAAFLQGRFQDHVAWTFGCGALQEVISAVRSFHPPGWQPRSETDEPARVMVLRAAIREGHVETVHMLVAQGIALDPHGPYDDWPLWEACRAPSPQRVDVVKALLEGGADPNATQQSADNVLLGVIDAFPEPVADLAPIAALLLDHGLELEARDSINRTALIAASGRGVPELVAVLLERGAEIHGPAGGPLNEPALAAAMRGDRPGGQGRHREVIELLLRHGADPGALRPGHEGLLHHAAARGYATLARELVDRGTEVDGAARDTRTTSMMEAAKEGQAETVKLLLDHRAAVDATDYAGREALALAAGEGHAEVVALLLDRGANIHARDREGNTALLHAVRGGLYQRPDLGTIETLLSRGASAGEADHDGVTALMFASARRRADVVRCLLAHGAAVDATDREGHTALDRLAERLLDMSVSVDAREKKGTHDVAEVLLGASADVNRRDATGCTAVALAALVGRTDLVELLLDHRADPDLADEQGVTPLMQAALRGRVDAGEWLLLHEADVNARTRSGRTALDLADDPAMIRLLEGAGATRAGAGPICLSPECPICRRLSDREFADENRGEELPPAFARLVKAGEPYLRSGPYRCPYCGRRYELDDTADNSEHYPVYQLNRVGEHA